MKLKIHCYETENEAETVEEMFYDSECEECGRSKAQLIEQDVSYVIAEVVRRVNERDGKVVHSDRVGTYVEERRRLCFRCWLKENGRDGLVDLGIETWGDEMANEPDNFSPTDEQAEWLKQRAEYEAEQESWYVNFMLDEDMFEETQEAGTT